MSFCYDLFEKTGDEQNGQRQVTSGRFTENKGVRLIDDDFLNACFDDNIECTKLILRIILGRPDIVVKRVETQKVMIFSAQSLMICIIRS